MVAATLSIQSSLLDLARAGDFSALAYWINRVLIPDGFYAHVEGHGARGCVSIYVECPAPRAAEQTEVQTNIIRRICHQLWQLNSTVIHGVKVSGSVPGRAEVLWQRTVRIVTPANQRTAWSGSGAPSWTIVASPVLRGVRSVRAWIRSRYKALRLLLLAGTAAAAFTFGSWVSVHSALDWVDRTPQRLSLTPAAEIRPRLGSEPLGSEPPSPMPDMMSQTVSRSGASSASTVSGLDRIQAILQELSQSSVTSVTPPPNRLQSKDVVLLIGGDLRFDGPLAGENAQAFAQLGALAAADVTAVNLASPLSLVDRAEAQFQEQFQGQSQEQSQAGQSPLKSTHPSPDQSSDSQASSSNSSLSNTSNVSSTKPRSSIAPDASAQTPFSSTRSGAIEAMNRAGIDVVNLANGRIMDDGEQGLGVTLKQLDRVNIATLGAGRTTDEAARAQIVEVKGVKIAYLGYATADYTIAQDRRSGINEALRNQIHADIVALRDRVDWIMVNYHWGDNATSFPAHWQTQLARETIDAGADAVIGHSPNALQGAETYADRPIVYSLGTLLYGDKYGFGGETALLRLRLDGKAISADFVPIEIWDGRPVAASEDAARWIVQHIEDLSQGFDRPLAQLAEAVEGVSAADQTISAERHRAAWQREPEDEATGDTNTPVAEGEPIGATPLESAAGITATTALRNSSASDDLANSARSSQSNSRGQPDTSTPSTDSRATEPGLTIAPDAIALNLARQAIPPLSGRTITEQSLDQWLTTHPQFEEQLPAPTPASNPEVDLNFQHPNLNPSRRNLADELRALDLEFDAEALSAPTTSPTTSPTPEAQTQPTVEPSRPSQPKIQLPNLPKMIAPEEPPRAGEGSTGALEPIEEAGASPFSSEPIVTQAPSPAAPGLPQRLPPTDLTPTNLTPGDLTSVGHAIGQWVKPKAQSSLSFTIPGRTVRPK